MTNRQGPRLDSEGRPFEVTASKDPNQLTFSKLIDLLVDDHAAYLFLESIRWPQGPVCPHCHSLDKSTFLTPRNETGKARATRSGTMSQRRVWKCRDCRKQFSVLTDTIFQGSHVPVRIWVLVVFQMAASKNGMAAKEVQRTYGLAPKTAWFVCHRIREAMKRSAPDKLIGTIEADETFIGGKAGNKHKAAREATKAENYEPVLVEPGTVGSVIAPTSGTKDKAVVLSLVCPDTGEIRSKVVTDVTGATLRKAIADQVHISGSHLVTDERNSYDQVGAEFLSHETVNHSADQYVRHTADGRTITTNRLEGYFSQLKRSLDGTHHHVSHEHLQRYLDEFDFRYSTRRMTDTERMLTVVEQAAGKRLAYKLCR